MLPSTRRNSQFSNVLVRSVSHFDRVKITVREIDNSVDIDWSLIHRQQQPIVIRGLISNWPAINTSENCWNNFHNVKQRLKDSEDIVPLEIGSSYMDTNLDKVHVSMDSFMDYLIASSEQQKSNKTVYSSGSETKSNSNSQPFIYLAQHDLNEVRTLRNDVVVPTICSTGKGTIYRNNIWWCGPLGSKSPCHYDPFQNILCQVIGEKTVLLLPPTESGNLYPAIGTLQPNTSLIDFDNPNPTKFPSISNIRNCYEAVLAAGDGLFVPLKWWHYCHTSTTSCSVNFWWL